jgi:hypothetical protein
MVGKRGKRFVLRKLDMKESRSRNAPRKYQERARRDARILEMLRQGSWPYTRVVRNWLAVRLGKPVSRITPEDVQQLLQGKI